MMPGRGRCRGGENERSEKRNFEHVRVPKEITNNVTGQRAVPHHLKVLRIRKRRQANEPIQPLPSFISHHLKSNADINRDGQKACAVGLLCSRTGCDYDLANISRTALDMRHPAHEYGVLASL